MDYQFGAILCFAIITSIIISVIAYKGINKDGKVMSRYDERQKAIRGKSFTFGFYATVIASALLMISHLFGMGDFWGPFGYFVAIIFGVIVQMTHAIFNDSYLGLNTNASKYMIFMSVISLINIAATAASIAGNNLIVDGVLQIPFMNLCCSILFAVLVADLGIKKLLDKKEK